MEFVFNCLVTLLLSFLMVIHSCSAHQIKTFEQFKKVFNKNYENTHVESLKKHNFEETLKRIEILKQEHPNIELAINEYSDLSHEEFEKLFPVSHFKGNDGSFYHSNSLPHSNAHTSIEKLPLNFDWRDKIKFSPVQNQGAQCGSCWAFAATTAVECQYARKNHSSNLNLSKQELVDCSEHSFDSNYRNHGCSFGYPTDAFAYITKKGILEEDKYPYTGTFQKCKRDMIHAKRYKLDGFTQMPFNQTDESMMKLLIEKGPLTVNIIGTDEIFRHYRNGIIRNLNPHTTHTNHIVVLVGYGQSHDNIHYWLIRNSWGTNWGIGGHATIERGYNQMGINNYVAYPILH